MNEKVDQYYKNLTAFKESFILLRTLLNSSDLKESYKWQIPVYTLNNKNVIGLIVLKSYIGLWFYQGAILKDPAQKLVNAQEGKTQAMRHWRFSDKKEIEANFDLITQYVAEALQNQKMGYTVKLKPKPLIIPPELNAIFSENPSLKTKFDNFSKSNKRVFSDYISEAKRPSTKEKRLLKIIPFIEKNIGLNDKYK